MSVTKDAKEPPQNTAMLQDATGYLGNLARIRLPCEIMFTPPTGELLGINQAGTLDLLNKYSGRALKAERRKKLRKSRPTMPGLRTESEGSSGR